VNFNYRIPKFRKWLLIYGDAFTEDEFSPLGYWRKSAYEGGLYVPRIPGIPKLDLRLEGGSSEPADFGTCVGCFYYNGRYTGGYTNQGNLMGSWLGRAGQSEQVWSTLWLTPRDTIQFNYQHFKAVANFVPDGGTLNNAGVSANIWWGQSVKFSGSVQFEKWNYPLLAPNARTNVSTSVGLSFWPHNWGLQAH
jgi:hypothetical protein